MNGRTNSTSLGANALEVPLDPCTNFAAKAGNSQVTLTWTDPVDKYATPEGEQAQDPQQLVSVWDHTIIVRKVGSQPANPNDGIIVTSSGVRNQYQNMGYIDTNLTNDTMYYYGAFAYNSDGVYSEGAFVSATPQAGTPIGELAEGTIITITESGAPVEFYVAKQNYEPGLNSNGRTLTVRKECIDPRPWNSSGINTWASSSLRSWLNGSYKNKFADSVQSQIGTTQYYYTPGNGNYTVTSKTDSVFLLSLTEFGLSAPFANAEGSTIPIANTIRICYSGGSPAIQWTRSPSTDSDLTNSALYIDIDGSGKWSYCTNSFVFLPCFTLPSTALVDSSNALIES